MKSNDRADADGEDDVERLVLGQEDEVFGPLVPLGDAARFASWRDGAV